MAQITDELVVFDGGGGGGGGNEKPENGHHHRGYSARGKTASPSP